MLEERSTACKLLAFGLFLYEALLKVARRGGAVLIPFHTRVLEKIMRHVHFR